MAKIIEQGYKRFRCLKCHSIIEYSDSELTLGKFNMDYLGDYDLKHYINCPSCKHPHTTD